jgi:hypothetical protein
MTSQVFRMKWTLLDKKYLSGDCELTFTDFLPVNLFKTILINTELRMTL